MNPKGSFSELHYFRPQQVNVAAEFLWRNGQYPDKQTAYKFIFELIKKITEKNLQMVCKGSIVCVMEKELVHVYVDPAPQDRHVAEVEIDLVQSIEV